MSKYTLEQQSHAEFQANRPVSATIESAHRVNQQIRPSSEILAGHYKSPEAEAIDRWFEDLSYYERTLEQMAKAKLDDNFREELKAIEQWFSVLTDPERTTALYSLLQHTTQVQIRFFITVLQQMAQKDPVSVNGVQGLTHAQRANMSGVPPGMQMSMSQKSKDGMSGNMGTIGRGTRRVFDRHSAPPTDETYGFQSVPFHGSDTGDDFEYKRNSVQSGSSSNRNSLQPLTPVDPINSANWSVPVTNPAPGHERSTQRSSMKLGNGSVASIVTSPRISGPDQKSASSPYAQNISPHPLSVPSSPILNSGMSPSQAAAMLALAQQAQTTGLHMNPQALMNAAATMGIQHPGSGWGHVDITPGSYSRPSGSPTGYARSDFSDSYDYESADNSSTGATGPHPSSKTRSAPSPGGPHKEKGKIPETIDLEALKDIPGWLRSLRLHKYTPKFENMDWKEMIRLTDEELSARGVAALGARRKMLKVFDMVKKDLESRGIPY